MLSIVDITFNTTCKDGLHVESPHYTVTHSAVLPPSGQRGSLHSSCSFLQFLMVLSIPTNMHSIQTRDHCSPVLSRSTCQEIPDGLQSVVLRIFLISWLDWSIFPFYGGKWRQSPETAVLSLSILDF